MAQYYPILSQDDSNTGEVTHYYQNIEGNQTIQYVIAADTHSAPQHQFQTQKVVDSSDQLMILEGQQGSQVIIDQLGGYQPQYIIQNSSGIDFPKNQQIYYMSNADSGTVAASPQIIVKQPIMQEQPVILNHIAPSHTLPKLVPTTPCNKNIPMGQNKSINSAPAARTPTKIDSNGQRLSQVGAGDADSKSSQGSNSESENEKYVALPNGSLISLSQYRKMVQQKQENEKLGLTSHNAAQRNRVMSAPKLKTDQTYSKSQQTARRLPQNDNQYVIHPHRPRGGNNKSHLQRRSLPPALLTPQIQNILRNVPKNDEYSDSIRMLVLLENGEQRLITFTLPKEMCTIQEILEQVNVPFNQSTPIHVNESNTEGLNYIVAVGNVEGFNSSDDDGDNYCSPPALSSQAKQQTPVEKVSQPPSPEAAKEQPPKLIEGKLAVCEYCGYLSEDFNKCIRCGRKLPENVKAINSAASNLTKKVMRSAERPIGFQKTPGVPRINLLQKKRVAVPKTKIMECETVVVSSDDEDCNAKNEAKILNSSFAKETQKSPLLVPHSKEPSNADIQKHHINQVSNAQRIPESDVITTFVLCRTVRIGSYRFVASEPIRIDSHSLTLRVPHPKVDYIVKIIKIDNINIVKILVCFQKQLPVIFFYYTSNVGTMVRQALDMQNENDIFFNPLSEIDESHKRITLLLEKITDESKAIIQRIFSKYDNLFDELNPKEANDILMKTIPKDVNRTPRLNMSTDIKNLLMYPPEGQGRITINTDDYICLGQDQFLNDVIIDFYLKYLQMNLKKELQEKVHIFSTFFYKRLTTKPTKATRKSQPAELDPNLTAAQKRHSRVKNWTKNVNIFDKDFVIIPINENCHWFLAIICYPNMNGCQTMSGQSIKIEPKQNSKKKEPVKTNVEVKVSEAGEERTVQIKLPSVVCEDEASLSDKDEAEGDDSELDSDMDESQTTLSVENNSQRPAIKQPCILIFDSLAGASRCRVVATLRDYLTCEYKAKLNAEKVFTKDVIKGACPKVPQQTNYTDCGLYLLQYVEQFFNDPIKDYYIPISHLKTWFDELTVTKKREDISLLIKSLMTEYGKDLSQIPDVTFPTLNGELVETLEKCDNFRDPDEEDEEQEEMCEDEDERELDRRELYEDENYAVSTGGNLNKFIGQVSTSSIKPDSSELSKKNDTLAYLKAKRIIRHKTACSTEPDVKKAKVSSSE